MRIEKLTFGLVLILCILFVILLVMAYRAYSLVDTYKKKVYNVMGFSTKHFNFKPAYKPGYFPPSDIPQNYDNDLATFFANTILSTYQKAHKMNPEIPKDLNFSFFSDYPDGSNPFAASITSNTTPGVYILSIRGTDDIIDLIQDLEFTMSNFYIDGRKYGRADAGFESVYEQYLSKFEGYLSTIPRDATLYITGHSLGAAIATMLAMKASTIIPKTCLYVFAPPKVGDNNFVVSLEKLVPTYWAIINQADLVPTLPLSIYSTFYQDYRKRVYINVQTGNTVSDHFIMSYLAGVDPESEGSYKDFLWNIQPPQVYF